MYSGDDAYMVLFIITQFVIAELYLQSRYPSVDECIEYLSLQPVAEAQSIPCEPGNIMRLTAFSKI